MLQILKTNVHQHALYTLNWSIII